MKTLDKNTDHRKFIDHSAACVLMKQHERPWTLALWGLLSICSGLLLVLVFQSFVLIFVLADPEHPNPEGAAFDIVRTTLNAFPVGGEILTKTGETTDFFDNVRDVPNSFFFCLGYVLGLTTLFGKARKLYKRTLIPFDRRVFAACRSPRAFDPLRPTPIGFESGSVMPWNNPEDGPRAEIWKILKTFTQPRCQPLEWALILGRPGSGKSRIAIEFARGPLGRRDLFGGASPKATKLQRLATWWKVQVCLRPCGENDFWDVGWIRPDKFYPLAEAGVIGVNLMLSELKQWRPRRPTLILLDDPIPDDARKVLETLIEIKNEFSHIVRLLIVNQSAPADLQLIRNSETGDWHSPIMPPAIQPIIISENNAFTALDIRRIRWKVLPPGMYSINQDDGVDEFLHMTRGNPLLIEIGFDWMRSHESFGEMSDHELLTFRVKKILASVETAGFEEEMPLYMTAATLCGGAKQSSLEEAYGSRLRHTTQLPRIFPADDVDLNVTLPSIRPEMIGFAFVRQVLGGVPTDKAKRLVEIAWKCNPRGTLRTALVIDRGRRIGHRDLLAELLETPPEEIDMQPLDLFAAYSEAACIIPREDWNHKSYYVGNGLETSAITVFRKLGPADGIKALDHLLNLMETNREYGVIRRSALNKVFVSVISGCLEQKAFYNLEKFLACLRIWLSYSTTYRGKQSLPTIPKELLHQVFKSEISESPGKVAASVINLVKSVSGQFSDRIVNAFVLSTGASLLEIVRLEQDQIDLFKQEYDYVDICWLELAQLMTLSLSEEQEGLFQRAEKISQTYSASAFCKVRAWRCVAYAVKHDPLSCEQMAKRVDELAAPFAGDRDFELERTVARRYVAYAVKHDPLSCEQMAMRVDELADSFAGDRAFELERTDAWLCVAYAVKHDPLSCEQMAKRVDELAAPFAGDWAFELERTGAWCHVAYAQNDPGASKRMAKRVDELAAPFAGDRAFELERTGAWCNVAYAVKHVPGICEQMAKRVDELAAPFAGDRAFELERTVARRYVAYAVKHDQGTCERTAKRVDELAAPFSGDRAFELERTRAWCSVVYAQNEPGACERTAKRMDELAAPFAGDRDFELERTRAWRYVAYEVKHDQGTCERMARLVTKIVALFPNDREFELERDLVWQYVLSANKENL